MVSLILTIAEQITELSNFGCFRCTFCFIWVHQCLKIKLQHKKKNVHHSVSSFFHTNNVDEKNQIKERTSTPVTIMFRNKIMKIIKMKRKQK
jgi:hypothetical protein